MKINYILLALGLLLAGCVVEVPEAPIQPDIKPPAVVMTDANCSWVMKGSMVLPDPYCTPGTAFPLTSIQVNGEYAAEPGTAYVGDICVVGYTTNVRDVTESTKKKIYLQYGLVNRTPYAYQIDHLIPLQLGGDNSVRNLWPLETDFKKRFKDPVETWLHDEVCEGRMNLSDAQRMIATDWTIAYNLMKAE